MLTEGGDPRSNGRGWRLLWDCEGLNKVVHVSTLVTVFLFVSICPLSQFQSESLGVCLSISGPPLLSPRLSPNGRRVQEASVIFRDKMLEISNLCKL